MSESESESSVSEVKDDDHVEEEEQSSATSEEDLTAGMGLQILAGSILEFDPEGDDARPFDVVAVHGYHGDRHTSWGGPYNNWLEDSLFARYPSSRVLTFAYDARGIKGTSTRLGIREKAVQLLDELVKLRKPEEPELFRPLIFISQDIGGIIVKEALCIAAFEYQKYRTIVQWSRLFIFFGCPHRSTSIQNMEDSIGNLLYANQYPRPIGALRTIKEISRSIIEINGSFFLSKIPTLGTTVNFYSEEEDLALQVFDRYTASFDISFGGSCIGKYGPLRDISSTSSDDIYDTINLVLAAYPKPSEHNKDSEQALRNLQLQAATALPLESKFGPERLCSWLSDDETFTSWFESDGSNLLHLHGATVGSDAGEYLFQQLSRKTAGEPLVYFSFDRYDDKRNTLLGMQNSIHAQIYSHQPVYHDAAIVPEQQMNHYHSWTRHELMTMFRNFCTNLSHTGCFIVISGLDECDDSIFPFLEKLCYLARSTEYKFKVALVSATKTSIQSALTGWPLINMNNHVPVTDLERMTSEIELEVLGLIQQYPLLYDFETTITEKLLKCGDDKDWRRLVLKEFQRVGSQSRRTTIQQELGGIEVTSPQKSLRGIMSRIPSEKKSWARKLLSWILYSYHPLSVWELAEATSPELSALPAAVVSKHLVHRSFVGSLDDLFDGAIIVKHNLVRFGHPSAREFFASSDLRPDAEKAAHRDILDTCQALLSSKGGQEFLEALYTKATYYVGEPPIFTHRYTLLTYTVMYWPRHFQAISECLLGEQDPPINKQDLEFVHNEKVMRSWAEAHWYLSNSIYRRDRGFLSMLPVFAGLGLRRLVSKWRMNDEGKIHYGEDSGLALVEAVRFGQTTIVHSLLASGVYTEKELLLALFAASSSSTEEALDKLVTYIGKNFPKFDWPATTVVRCCQFGHGKVLKKLLEYGASPDKGVELHSMTPLFAATREGNSEIVETLLEHKAPLDTKSQHGRSPLHAACVFGHAEVAKLLIAAGANLDALDNDNDTPVSLAVQWGNHKVLEVMVKETCVMDGTLGDLTIRTPLTIAADLGFNECARVMLSDKANTEVVCKSDWPPLRYAITKKNTELIKLLLDHGADPNTTHGGEPLITTEASEENFVAIKLLVEHGATVDALNSQGATALHCAAEKNFADIVTYLLEHGAAVNSQITAGHTSLALAASAGHVETVKILLDKGADVSIPSNDGWTPIGLSYDSAEVSRLLMEAGANGDRATNSYTPLYLASMYGYTETVKVLLSYSVNLETEYISDGYQTKFTALCSAVTNQHNEIVRLLLEAGADVNHLSERNNFCLQYAVRTDDPNMLRILMEYRPKLDLQDDDGDTAVAYIRSSAPIEMYQILVNGGASLEIPNKQMHTAICAAALSTDRPDIVKYFISKKANLNPVGGKHGGPLHIACRWMNFELVEMLVQAGADVDFVDQATAGNPLQSAARCWNASSNREGQEKIIRYLLDEGKADVNVVGGIQGCALNAVCGWASVDMVMLLLKKGAKTDVVDEMGRAVIHYAAMQSLENLQQIVSCGVDINAKDAMGRNAMHWAVVSGSPEVVERVLSLSRRLLDQPDNDGWTPLLWAARGCVTAHKETASNAQEQIITFLLDHGADILVKGKGLDRDWTPIQVARYHSIDDEVVQLLVKKTKEKLGKEELYIEAEHACLKASEQVGSCDSCHCQMLGNRYKCHDCLDIDFCYKCYKSRLILHNKNHTFDVIGPEYQVVVEVEKESTEEDDEDTDDDTDDDTDEDEDEEETSKS